MGLADSIRCPGCNGSLPRDARFCPKCGRPTGAFSATSLAPFSDTGAGPATIAPRTLPPSRLPEGTRLGVYRIVAVLGEGGMGVVYRAYDEALGREVAVKCLHTNLAGDPDIRRRFIREARILRSWSHPNIVAIHDFIEEDLLLAIVMELVEGPTLVGHLARWRGRMPYDEVRELFGGALEAMADGHTRGLVHRDLKPDNILVMGGTGGAGRAAPATRTGALVPKIVDFGLARILEGTTYTMSGAFLGTCRYMSPEQVKSPQSADHRADIYSLGVTLYQLVTGRVPFDTGNHFAVMMAHVHEAPPAPSALRPDVPPLLERLILDALSKDPAGRPPSCKAFLERLDEAIGPVRAPSTSTGTPLPPVRRSGDGTEMVLVPAGPFQMGPARRQIHLDGFYVDRLPVTNEQFVRFLEVTRYQPTDEGAARFVAHLKRGKIPAGLERHPATYVSWIDARAYAAWAGKRLPTEAEWEKSARGTDGRPYPWGRDKPTQSRANYGGLHRGALPVGALPEGASPYGVLDLAGNVWEWCEDAFDPSFYADGPTHNPRNTSPSPRSLQVMRGGSWMYAARSLKTFARTSFEAHYRFAGGGFRCARTG
jgi:serine/threonine protein kinase